MTNELGYDVCSAGIYYVADDLMFSASTTVNVKLATQDLPTGLITKMDELDHVDIETYQDLDQAKRSASK